MQITARAPEALVQAARRVGSRPGMAETAAYTAAAAQGQEVPLRVPLQAQQAPAARGFLSSPTHPPHQHHRPAEESNRPSFRNCGWFPRTTTSRGRPWRAKLR